MAIRTRPNHENTDDRTAQWAQVQSETEYTEHSTASDSVKSSSNAIELHFDIPCGEGQASLHQVVAQICTNDNAKFHIRDIVKVKNKGALGCFLEQQKVLTSELIVNFHLSTSEDNKDCKDQIKLCLQNLVDVADRFSLTINAEYTMAVKPVSRRELVKKIIGMLDKEANDASYQTVRITNRPGPFQSTLKV